jgi:hypothetical protein
VVSRWLRRRHPACWIQMASRHWPCLIIFCCRCGMEKKASIFVGCKSSWGIDRSTRKQIASSFRNSKEMTTSASHLDSGLALPWLASGERRQLRVGLMSSRTALSSMQGYKIRRFYRNSPKIGEFGPHQLDLLFMISNF